MSNDRAGRLVRLSVNTYHPEDYVLLNEADGTRWRGTKDGVWKWDDRTITEKAEALYQAGVQRAKERAERVKGMRRG